MKASSNIIHTYPQDDTYEHVLSGFDCPCNPRVDKVADDTTGVIIGFVVVHNAWDGRENFEQGLPTNDLPL